MYAQSHVDTLERRINRLEARNRLLTQQLESASSPSGSVGLNGDRGLGTASADRGGGRRSADVIGEVSYLSINTAGERHYLGSSSGVLLANFIKDNVEVETVTRPPSPQKQPDDYDAGASAMDVVPDLPPESISRRLIMAYLDHDHLCYPIVQPASLLALLKKIYETDMVFYTLHPYEAFVFDMILAIATTSVCRSDWHVLPSAQSHYLRAMSKVSDILQMGGLGGLQATILLTQYRMSSSIKDNSASK